MATATDTRTTDAAYLKWAWMRLVALAKSEDRPGSALCNTRNLFALAQSGQATVTSEECDTAEAWIYG